MTALSRDSRKNEFKVSFQSLMCMYSCGLTLEVVDGGRISQVKVATISKIVGKRLHIKYYDDEHGSGKIYTTRFLHFFQFML